MRDSLVGDLRRFARVHPYRSRERLLFNEAADALEELGAERGEGEITAEQIERVLGGKLMKWQKARLEEMRG